MSYRYRFCCSSPYRLRHFSIGGLEEIDLGRILSEAAISFSYPEKWKKLYQDSLGVPGGVHGKKSSRGTNPNIPANPKIFILLL